jgi:plasmid stabilization system protein ParE
MKRYVLATAAERDLDDIRAYVRQRSGSAAARAVIREFQRAIQFVGRHPDAEHTRTDITTLTVKFWPVYSYVIVYDPSSRPVVILRVLHGMRDLESILN